jgi:hypothetical protein
MAGEQQRGNDMTKRTRPIDDLRMPDPLGARIRGAARAIGGDLTTRALVYRGCEFYVGDRGTEVYFQLRQHGEPCVSVFDNNWGAIPVAVIDTDLDEVQLAVQLKRALDEFIEQIRGDSLRAAIWVATHCDDEKETT